MEGPGRPPRDLLPVAPVAGAAHPQTAAEAVAYHHATKHHFNRFARSRGHLDWASQPDPFRRYAGAPLDLLPHGAVATDVPYSRLFDGSLEPALVDAVTVGEFLRCAMGLSAWKQYEHTRWALRVNPSSGNLHPTEAYVLWDGRLAHYAPKEHALETRCAIDAREWRRWVGAPAEPVGTSGFLVALTSIFWREAWKYGERAFRYCQHDTGHAIAALRLSAARLGWTLTLLPRWSDAQIAALTGIDRDDDFIDAEREHAECVALVTRGDASLVVAADPAPLVAAARQAAWNGAANRLSASHVDWPIIDAVARATRYPGRDATPVDAGEAVNLARTRSASAGSPAVVAATAPARELMLRRRSAVAFDGRSSLPRETFVDMLTRLQPAAPPWDAIDWGPHVHLALFVHRVDGITPGLYACLRDATVLDEWRASMRPEFLWEPVAGSGGALHLLVPVDVSWPATRVSCDQDIAGAGFFSLGMLARFSPLLRRHEWWYRRLFWECGMIGQVLYLEAEAAAARATGIGCFYDDPVHELLGLAGDQWQSLYHFSMGVPVEDARLTTAPGYEWEG